MKNKQYVGDPSCEERMDKAYTLERHCLGKQFPVTNEGGGFVTRIPTSGKLHAKGHSHVENHHEHWAAAHMPILPDVRMMCLFVRKPPFSAVSHSMNTWHYVPHA